MPHTFLGADHQTIADESRVATAPQVSKSQGATQCMIYLWHGVIQSGVKRVGLLLTLEDLDFFRVGVKDLRQSWSTPAEQSWDERREGSRQTSDSRRNLRL